MTDVSALFTISDPVSAASIHNNRYGVLKHFRNAAKKKQPLGKTVSFSCELQVYRTERGEVLADEAEGREAMIVRLYPNAIKVLPPVPHGSRKDKPAQQEMEDPL